MQAAAYSAGSTALLNQRFQWWIDEHWWKAVWYAAEWYVGLHRDPYTCCRFANAIKEGAWNRVCGGPQSFWHIFKLSMGWSD